MFGALLTVCFMLLYTPLSYAESSEYQKELHTEHNGRKISQERKEDIEEDDEIEAPKEDDMEDDKRAMQDPENAEDDETLRGMRIPHKDPYNFRRRRRQWFSARRRYYVYRYRRRSYLRIYG